MSAAGESDVAAFPDCGGEASVRTGTVVLLKTSASSTRSTVMPSKLPSRSPIWRGNEPATPKIKAACSAAAQARPSQKNVRSCVFGGTDECSTAARSPAAVGEVSSTPISLLGPPYRNSNGTAPVLRTPSRSLKQTSLSPNVRCYTLPDVGSGHVSSMSRREVATPAGANGYRNPSGASPRRIWPTASKWLARDWICWESVCMSRNRRSNGLRAFGNIASTPAAL